MSKLLKALALLTVLAISASCSTDRPLIGGVCPPAEIIRVPVPYYVPIEDELTAPLPIATGSLADIPAVSRERRKALETCNIDRATVRKKQGTAVPEK